MENTQLGWYDNAQKPVLTINSGDTVVMETMMHFHDRLVPGGPALDELLKIRPSPHGASTCVTALPHLASKPLFCRTLVSCRQKAALHCLSS
jgi:acetamidase/formamidase